MAHEQKLYKHYFDCRSTGQGAYTSAGGRRFDVSRTGNHWREVVEAAPVRRSCSPTSVTLANITARFSR